MNPGGLLTRSIRSLPNGDVIARILISALQAVEPGEAILRQFHRLGNVLWVNDRAYDLTEFNRIRLIGFGKAGYPMAKTVAEILGPKLTGGLVVVKDGYLYRSKSVQNIKFYEASHPIPDERGIKATLEILDLIEDSYEHDLIIVLISGGGSALLTAPVPGVTLSDMQKITADMLASGATIQEINTLRKHLDLVKGGGLARAAIPATVVTLILSDVIGDSLDVIASGPTVPDPSTFSDALSVLERYHLTETTSPAILDHLQDGAKGTAPETPKPGERMFDRVYNVIVGSNWFAAEAGLEAAKAAGFNSLILTTSLQGEARQAGQYLAEVLQRVVQNGVPLPRPACLIAGGETTVTLTNLATTAKSPGLGGRNQELALAAALAVDGLKDVIFITLATDGGDGPTDAAGAVVTGETIQYARQVGIDAQDFLDRHDSYHFFAALGDLLKPGPTNTNVNDLNFLFAL